MHERHVAAAAPVQDQDVKEYYLVHKQEYTAPERVRARHILVSVKRGAYPAEVSNAWNKASLLRRRVLEGEPFSEVARQESDCPSRDNGGDLGYFEPGQMVPAFTDKVFKLKRCRNPLQH